MSICLKSPMGQHEPSPRYKITCLWCRVMLPKREELAVVNHEVGAGPRSDGELKERGHHLGGLTIP
jgi:hypothetical protein